MVEHGIEFGRILKGAFYGVLDKAGNAWELESFDTLANLLDLFLRQSYRDFFRRHTRQHINSNKQAHGEN